MEWISVGIPSSKIQRRNRLDKVCCRSPTLKFGYKLCICTVLDNSTSIIHTPQKRSSQYTSEPENVPVQRKTIYNQRLGSVLVFNSFLDAKKQGLPWPLLWPHERCGHSPCAVPIPFQWGWGSPDLKAMVKLGDVFLGEISSLKNSR